MVRVKLPGPAQRLALLTLALVTGATPGAVTAAAVGKSTAPVRGHAAKEAQARRGRGQHNRHHRRPKRRKRPRRNPFPGAFTLAHFGTTIAPGAGIGAVRFPTTVTPGQILARYGNPPQSRFFVAPPILRENGVIVQLNYRHPPSDAKWSDSGITFQFDPGPSNAVIEMTVESPTYHTAKGIRVGSTARQVVHAYASTPGFGTVASVGYALHQVDSAGHMIYTDFDFFGSSTAQAISVYDCTAAPELCQP